MSRRGAGSVERKPTEFEFISAPALAQPVITLARQLMEQGLSSAEVCSLFTHAASTLARNDDGLERQEWLDLCEQLHDGAALEDQLADGRTVTAPGGSA